MAIGEVARHGVVGIAPCRSSRTLTYLEVNGGLKTPFRTASMGTARKQAFN